MRGFCERPPDLDDGGSGYSPTSFFFASVTADEATLRMDATLIGASMAEERSRDMF